MPARDPIKRAAYARAYAQTPSGKAARKKAWDKQRENQRNDPTWRSRHNEYQRARYARLGTEARYAEHLTKKYGMSQDDFAAMARAQDHRCSICCLKSKLHVDHCHVTGKVRSLLCAKCNMGLGMFKENTDALRKAVHYLEHHNGDG